MVTLKMNETENKNMNTENSEGRKLDIFLKKINETDQSLATLTKKEWKKIPISKLAAEEGMSLLTSQKWEEPEEHSVNKLVHTH